MKKLSLVLAFAVALPSFAADSYRFRVTVTDGRTALLSNPDFDKLHLTADQIQSAAKDRVMMLNESNGTHWRWLMLSFMEKQQTIDDSGSNGSHADLGLTAAGESAVQLRCLRDACTVAVGGEELSLKKGEATTVPSDSHVEIAFR